MSVDTGPDVVTIHWKTQKEEVSDVYETETKQAAHPPIL